MCRVGMLHGFADSVGRVKASAQALDAVGEFISDKLRAGTGHVSDQVEQLPEQIRQPALATSGRR